MNKLNKFVIEINDIRLLLSSQFKGETVFELCGVNRPGDTVYVIAFLKWNKKEGDLIIDSLGSSLLNMDTSSFIICKKMMEIARDMFNLCEGDD